MAFVDIDSIPPRSHATLFDLDAVSSLLRDDPSREDRYGIKLSSIQDELTRFTIWASNIGAFQPANSVVSLVQRLKHAPRVAGQVIHLLNDMIETIQDVHSIASGDRANRTYEVASESDADGPSKGLPQEISEIQELVSLISEINSNLFDISTKIRKASPRDRYLRAEKALPELVAQYAFYDNAHVIDKFPKLRQPQKAALVKKLALGITRRRQYLQYCQAHASKISTTEVGRKTTHREAKGKFPAMTSEQAKTHQSTSEFASPLTEETLTTVPSTYIEDKVVEDPVSRHEEQGVDEDATPSIQATSIATVDGESPAIATLENLRKGNVEFICPYCTQPQKFRRNRNWKEHALEDLRPYICTFENCPVMFARRHDWFNHERQYHRVHWLCGFCSHGPFVSEQAFQSHLLEQHSRLFIAAQLPLLLKDGRRPIENIPAADCLFCDKLEQSTREMNPEIGPHEVLTVPWTAFRNHVGRHMRSLATFAIPRGIDENGEDDEVDADNDNSAKAALADSDVGFLESLSENSEVSHTVNKFDPTASTSPRLAPGFLEISNETFEDSTHTYMPMKNDTEIRILTLLPGVADDHIRAELSTVHIDAGSSTSPHYEALAYVWGEQRYTQAIFVNNQRHGVTQNLFEALAQLRYVERARILWIDSICINMDDIEERRQQISQMRDIFQNSARVLVWLGPEADDSTLAMMTLSRIGVQKTFDRRSQTIKPILTASSDSIDWGENDTPPPLVNDGFVAITYLLRRQLFSRIWVWQEVQLASDEALVIAGSDQIPLGHFRNALWYLAWKRTYDYYPIWSREYLLTALAMVDKTPNKQLRSLIEQTRSCQCSDPRDRIYALLALSNTPLLLEPDYSKSILEIYRQVVVEHVMRGRDMNILSSWESPSSTDWPTWVPNWTVPSQCWQPFSGLYAAGDTYPGIQKPFSHDELEVEGVLIGLVADVISLDTSNKLRGGFNVNLLEKVQQIARDGYGWNIPENRRKDISVLCRILCGNRFSDRYEPPRGGLLDFEMSKLALRDLLDTDISLEDFSGRWSIGAIKLLREIETMAKGRSFLKSDSGQFGLGINASKPGDSIVVLLGCNSPMIIRHSHEVESAFEIIGPAYVDGFSEAQAVLGQLPKDFTFRYQYNHTQERFQPTYVNASTGLADTDDPRLEPLDYKWHVVRYPGENNPGEYSDLETPLIITRDPRLTSEALEKRGIMVERFRLV